MSSDVKIPEWARDEAQKIDLPTLSPLDREYARRDFALALIAAERRGLEKAAPLLERLREWIEEEVGAELPLTEAQQAEFDAIRSLGEQE